MQQDTLRRLSCSSCLRPQTACICRWIVPTCSVVEVLILQHPMENREAKGSARLLHLSLHGSKLVVGESFSEQELHALLYQPLVAHQKNSATQTTCARQPLLLYPESTTRQPVAKSVVAPADPRHVRLVVLDGTWRKSRKLLHMHPLLQALPRLSLIDAPPTQYRIRKAHAPDQLSTLEASCHALAQLESDSRKYLPLLQAFDGFVSDQLRYRPSSSTCSGTAQE
ncbi:tRNA-uridine aminocarboxypropyltransferase [Noviherbaspirillum saxi]